MMVSQKVRIRRQSKKLQVPRVGRDLRFAATSVQTHVFEGVGRKIQINNAEGVHINFRHFRHFSSL